MDPEKFKNQTKKVTRTMDVDIISTKYIDPEYEIKALSNNSVTDTGRLEIAKLIPKKQNLFEFIFRWDKNGNTLDVDIYKDNKAQSKDLWFEVDKNKGYYTGHQTKKRDSNNMIFKVDISNVKLDKRIFKGEIDVGLFFELIIKDSGVGIDTVSVRKFNNKEIKTEEKVKSKDEAEAMISMYDPVIDAYRDIPISCAKKLIQEAKKLEEQLNNKL